MAPRLAAAAIAAFLALPALPAVAATGVCTFQGVSQQDFVTGVLSASGGDLQATVDCEVRVDGSPVASVQSTGGNQSEQVSFTAWPHSAVELCGTLSTPFGSDSACTSFTVTHVPPQEVEDLLHALVDPIGCPVLAALNPGVPGVVDIDPSGDTYVAGVPVHDCPPYGGSSTGGVVGYWEARLELST